MKKINIQINQAKLLSYEVDLLLEEEVQIRAVIGLFAGTKQISTFTLSTQSYYSNNIKFDIPIGMVEPIKKIAKELETILVRECSKSFALLSAPKK